MSKLSLIMPTQGNPIALKRTLDSTKSFVDEIIVGSVCVFREDDMLIETYKSEYNLRVVHLPFNYIFTHGFSYTLNNLASLATNNMVLYLNVGEIVEKSDGGIAEKIQPEYNAYYIDHSQENHRWWRCYNRHQLKWDGLIHEEVIGDYIPFHKALFTFADTEKDMVDPFKAKVKNDIKECVYWRQLTLLVEHPELLSSTNEGWLQFAKDTYKSMTDRIAQKGNRWQYFIDGNYEALMNDYYTNPEFEKERFESNTAIEFQGSPMFLGKK